MVVSVKSTSLEQQGALDHLSSKKQEFQNIFKNNANI